MHGILFFELKNRYLKNLYGCKNKKIRPGGLKYKYIPSRQILCESMIKILKKFYNCNKNYETTEVAPDESASLVLAVELEAVELDLLLSADCAAVLLAALDEESEDVVLSSLF